MQTPPKEKPFLQAIRGKVIAAFFLAFLAIVFALGITYYSFDDLLNTVDQLASPNEKLKKLNIFFQHVTQLDQQQRAEAIKNPRKPSEEFLQESKVLLLSIDTLRAMDWKDPQQLERLSAMEKILNRRDELFLSYLKLKSDFIYNRNFSKRLDSLSGVLSSSRVKGDTSVRTTQKKIVTKTYHPLDTTHKTEANRSFFSRLFSRKKESKPLDPKVEVHEELSVKIDTLAIAQDSVIGEVGRIMKSLEQDQRQQNKNMIQGELELINTNTILMNQLLGILRQVEEEELALMHQNSHASTQLVSTTIKRIGLIILLFFLGAALLVFLILTDIAKSNFYRKQLLKAKEEAEQLGQVKQRFLANMSHEIRTPLQSIIGFAEQLRLNDPEGKEALDAIYNSSEHLLHIVNEVLDYSRIESGKFTVEKEPFNLQDIIREVCAGIEIQAEQKGLTLLCEVNVHTDVFLLGDGFRLRQILYNILGNAVKFTNKGFVKLNVTIDNTDYTVKCKFEITDTGIGMDQKDIDRVFQQFEQANASINHQYGGTGLGLTIVKALIEAQNGSIKVSSMPGSGSVFTIYLNYDHAPSDHYKRNDHARTKHMKKSKRVLIVDDDPLILRLCSLILQKHHIDYVAFQDPAKVKQFNDFHNIDLVLLDIRMPNINGVELCQALRKKIGRDTRIVALTAHVLPQERAGLIEACFDNVLTKPFREQQLLDVIGIKAVPDKAAGIEHQKSIDLSSVKKMAMGDEILFHSILVQFLEESEDDIKKIMIHVEERNVAAIREIIHKLAGRTGQMGMTALSAEFKEIEKAIEKESAFAEYEQAMALAIGKLEDCFQDIRETMLMHQV